MNLSELFPQGAKVQIQGKEYELKFSTRTLLQLEKDYPEKDEVTTQEQIADLVKKALSTKGLKASDLVNLLFAVLLHTKDFSSKEVLIDAIEPKDFSDYVDAIIIAYMQSKPTSEQLEKLEVMSQTGDTKKKTESETTELNTHSTE